MKKLNIIALLVLTISFSCKESPKTTDPVSTEDNTENLEETKNYPAALQAVFEAHGGFDLWKDQKTLVYSMADTGGMETSTTDLRTRKDRIDSPVFSMGYNGENVWLKDEKKKYEGDPVFYHNLMFYFYAMPFVLGDNGINYGETTDLVFEGKHYPGLSISYDSGVGTSPKDEYFIHYDPETKRMAWLGYTVTYRSGEKSDNVKWIRYNDWMSVNDLILPKSLTWHAYEGRDIKEAKSTVEFENVSLSESAKPSSFYAIPEGGEVVEGKKM